MLVALTIGGRLMLRTIFCTAICLLSLIHTGCQTAPTEFSHSLQGTQRPWTHDSFDTGPDRFMFAIFSDLQSGEREGVFAIAMEQMNLLRPELILSVGDLIDGGTEDRAQLNREWDDFDRKLSGVYAPVFRTGGNHDLTNLTMREVWAARYGARYYHFVYKNVLFLMVDSEDYEVGRMQEIYHARAQAIAIADGDAPGEYEETEYFHMPERRTGAMSAEQAAYFRRVIAEHPEVAWTFLVMHKPLWRDDSETDFQSLEAALSDRPYTVINGHFHSYSLTRRHGRDYIHLGTTSGGQADSDAMAFDHITLVTMTGDGPAIANLRLGGILDATGHVPLDGDDVCFQASACKK
jgi:hypothetical protein